MEEQSNSIRMPSLRRLSSDYGQNSHVTTTTTTTHNAILQCGSTRKKCSRSKRERRKIATTELGDHQLCSAQMFPTSEFQSTSILRKNPLPASTESEPEIRESVCNNNDQLAQRITTEEPCLNDESSLVPTAQPYTYTLQHNYTLYHTIDHQERNCAGCGKVSTRSVTSPSTGHFCEECSLRYPKCDGCNRRFEHSHPFAIRYYTVQQMVCECCENVEEPVVFAPFYQDITVQVVDARLEKCCICKNRAVGPSQIDNKNEAVCDLCWIEQHRALLHNMHLLAQDKERLVQHLFDIARQQEQFIAQQQLVGSFHIAIIKHLTEQLKRLGQEPLSPLHLDDRMYSSANSEASIPN